MSKFTFLLVAIVMAAASAFTTPMVNTNKVAFTASPSFPSVSTTSLNMVEDMTWEGEEYPPSKVLGPLMSKMSSQQLGIVSIIFAAMCVVSVQESAVLAKEAGAIANGSWVKWYYVLGSFGGPLAWGTHVAAWIQRKNGM
eukprot:CAMPEP_0178962888 /NCGR_PEP_ID=MMETSP0789-20121207/14654_1 /TAXON_ID=3005 /ORGANISM="Rhizosolenia setigera, Strain CCMP 1694" /LENGTH=139 /DNA_ID=CAMNT_0020647167 /DNA_START=47 /DNA_END=466 /DNA_ORIENTATION=+